MSSSSSSSLENSQRVLADALRRASLLRDDPEAALHAERIASGNDRLSPVEQVDIYREQFWLRHVDVIREDFASIERVLGDDDAFEALAKAYLIECPSASFTLRDLGEHMARFLRERAPWSEDPFLAELARVEWAFVDAFDGPDAPPFDPTTIAGVSEEAWPTATIVLQPSMQRLSLTYPAHDYRIAVKDDPDSAQTLERPSPRPCNIVVYRGGGEQLRCLEVDNDAMAMLDELANGAPLGEACERAAQKSGADLDAFQAKLAIWFSEWTAAGWIRAVRFKSS